MGVATLLSPDTWATDALPPPGDRAAFDRLSAEIQSLLDSVKRERPIEGTETETVALRRFYPLLLSLGRAFGPAFLQVSRTNVNQALGDLVRKELDAAEPERKLALRHVEQAVHTYGVLMESFGAAFVDVTPALIGALLDSEVDRVKSGEFLMSEPDRVVLRFLLGVMVALDVLDAPLDELTFWAFRAITDARRVEANPNAFSPTGLRGELARIRARCSWLAWDETELAKELAPWPTPSR